MYQKLFIGKDIKQSGNTFAWTAASGIAYSLQSLIFLMVITNISGKSEGGLYSLGIMIANQMLTVGKFSVRNYQVSDINQKYSFDQYYTFRIFTCLIAMFVTVGWIFFGGYRGEEAIVILSLTVYKMAECLSDLFEGLYQQRFRFDISGKSQFTKDVLMTIVFVAVFLVTRKVVVASIVLAVVSMLLIFVVDFPIAKYFDKIKWNFSWKINGQLMVACCSLFVSSFFFVYIHNAPKYAITAVTNNNNEILAEFNALFMPVFVVDLFAGFTMRMWLTKMAIFHRDGEYKKFKQTILKQLLVIIGITICAMLGMYLLGEPVLSMIYGIDLYGYKWTNVLLMLSGGLVAIYTLFENVIIIYRKQYVCIFINITTAIVSAIVVTPLTLKSGILGATIGYVIANIVRSLLYYLFALFFMIKGKKETKE